MTIDPGAGWDRRFSERPWPTDPDPLLVGLAQPLPAGRALDVASGPGRNSLWLAGRGWSVTAVDASTVALTLAQERADASGVRLRTVQADVLTWTPPASAYELVVLANLHPAQGELADLLARLTVALVPDGHLFVVGHDLANLGRDGPRDPDRLLTVARLAAAIPPGLSMERLVRVVRSGTDTEGDTAVLGWGRRLVADA